MGFRSLILDLLFPPRCVFCRSFLKGEKVLVCADCVDTLPYCEEERAIQPGEFYTYCISPLYFDGHVRKSLHRFKFEDARDYRRAYSAFLADCVRTHYKDKYDMISWVPVSRERRKKRGYDQAMLLALATALELDDVAAETLRKVKNAAPQSELGGRDERRANISGAYEVTDEELIAGKRILLIDDVVTTGATLSEAARSLLMAGADQVLCATLARSLED
ncbi:MAG: double zinc ribbon domain-containing protein [Oscillospiraceae bacterium]|nr:double zinc ribbon domain-containing protein [Oscillospiraceae bacterium]